MGPLAVPLPFVRKVSPNVPGAVLVTTENPVPTFDEGHDAGHIVSQRRAMSDDSLKCGGRDAHIRRACIVKVRE
jgi:hypothetical protein